MEKKREQRANRNNPANTVEVSKWDCGSPLYDSFELVSIYSRLDRGLAITTTTDQNARGRRGYNSSFPCKFVSENVNLQCECCKKRKRNRFGTLFRLAFGMSRTLWRSDLECPRHRVHSRYLISGT